MSTSFNAWEKKFLIKKENLSKAKEIIDKELGYKTDSIEMAFGRSGMDLYFTSEGDINGFYWDESYEEGFAALCALAPVVEDGAKVTIIIREFGWKYILRFKDGECAKTCEDLDDDEEDEDE